jgi:hypothetical protein
MGCCVFCSKPVWIASCLVVRPLSIRLGWFFFGTTVGARATSLFATVDTLLVSTGLFALRSSSCNKAPTPPFVADLFQMDKKDLSHVARAQLMDRVKECLSKKRHQSLQYEDCLRKDPRYADLYESHDFKCSGCQGKFRKHDTPFYQAHTGKPETWGCAGKECDHTLCRPCAAHKESLRSWDALTKAQVAADLEQLEQEMSGEECSAV